MGGAPPVPSQQPWPRLVEEATAVMRLAYAPYSDYQVGAAGRVLRALDRYTGA